MCVLSNGEFAVGGCPVKNLSCGGFVQWRISCVAGLSSREFVVWEFCPVENLSCWGFVQWRICCVWGG